jgi:hypothetical protein
MLFKRKPVASEIVEGWQFDGPRSVEAAPSWLPAARRVDKDPGQKDKAKDARLVIRDGGAEIMLYVGHWLIRHADGALEPMTDEQVQAKFEPA